MAAIWETGIVVAALLLVAALLAAAEAAFAAASRGKLHGMADRGEPGAAVALRLTEDRPLVAAALLLPRALAEMLAISMATALMVGRLGAGEAIAAALALALAVAVFSELLPRARGAAAPEAVATRAARSVDALVALLGPLVRHFRADAAAPAQPELGPQGESDAEAEERARVLGAFDLSERRVEEVMMHRRDIEMIDAEADPAAILEQAINSPHTRLPIYRGEPENIVGVIHAKDLSRAVHRFVREHHGDALQGFDVMDVAMPPYFVPESTPLDEQMREFLRRRTHFALVVDEYGALQGLVTLEDILEEIVGDIADEHDVEAPGGIERQPDGWVEVDGAVTIRELNRACDWELPDEEANTIAGLVIHEAQAIPAEGQAFAFHGFRFEVLARQGNRLARLRMRRLE